MSKFRRERQSRQHCRILFKVQTVQRAGPPACTSVAAVATAMRGGSSSAGQLPPSPGDARAPQRHPSKARPLSISLHPRASRPRRAAEDKRFPLACAPAPSLGWRWGLSPRPAVPFRPERRTPAPQPPAPSGPQDAGLRSPTRRRYGDSHETPAAPASANGSARRGETRTSLFQDGGASVASGRAGGKPAKPTKAAARERTEGAVAAVGGGSGSFRCCYGCCHAARLGRSSLPWGVIMLTEVSGDGGQCLPVKWGRGRCQPASEHHFSRRRARPSAAGRGAQGVARILQVPPE